MIDDTMAKLEQSLDKIPPQKRVELLNLVGALKKEISDLAQNNPAGAESIAGFTQVAAHEATRADRDEKLLELSAAGLAESVKRFESSHPGLVKTVNHIANALASLGL